MAKMSINGINALTKMLDDLGSATTEASIEAVEAAAGLVADTVRARYESSLAGSDYSQGDMMDAFGVSPTRQNTSGSFDASIGFHGYDSKGVANVLKARARESGTSRQPKNPVFRPAVNSIRKRARKLMEDVITSKWRKVKR